MSKYADVVKKGRLNKDLVRAFFLATTKVTTDFEDILPQEGGEDSDFSVFGIFAKLFPQILGGDEADEKKQGSAYTSRLRLHFNKVGYQIYEKAQSRRVPSLQGSPGNPGYGFKRARWRDTHWSPEDVVHCETVLRAAGCNAAEIKKVQTAVQEAQEQWHKARRTSRPSGPGRPRRVVAPKKEEGEQAAEKGTEGVQKMQAAPAGPVPAHFDPSSSGHLSNGSPSPTRFSSSFAESLKREGKLVLVTMLGSGECSSCSCSNSSEELPSKLPSFSSLLVSPATSSSPCARVPYLSSCPDTPASSMLERRSRSVSPLSMIPVKRGARSDHLDNARAAKRLNHMLVGPTVPISSGQENLNSAATPTAQTPPAPPCELRSPAPASRSRCTPQPAGNLPLILPAINFESFLQPSSTSQPLSILPWPASLRVAPLYHSSSELQILIDQILNFKAAGSPSAPAPASS